ncbi:hypothetical protein WJX73_005404 [Symbiochloris irregularis]|uniref:Cyclin N-terminal domain-containing protein n=1 Tax=Symbiochloris irregularis TaxID=706552 RepID=A0AAW1NYE2_9CHLO
MPRRGRSAPMRSPSPPPSRSHTSQARSPPPPAPRHSAPPPAQSGGGGGMLSGLGGMVAQGMALGTGSALAHRAIFLLPALFSGAALVQPELSPAVDLPRSPGAPFTSLRYRTRCPASKGDTQGLLGAAAPVHTARCRASWCNHKPRLSIDSPNLPASCDSNASTEDYMLSWSQSYAASRSSFSRRSSLDSVDSFDSQLLCQEDMAEVEHHVPTPASLHSNCSSASDTFALNPVEHEAAPVTWSLGGPIRSYAEDPPQAADIEKCELPHMAPDSLSYNLARVYGFSPHCISLGTAFLRRLAARDPLLLSSALSTPDFAPFMQGVQPSRRGVLTASIGYPTHTCQSAKIYCMAIHLTCIYLAAKSVEMVPFKRLLQTMLSHVHERQVSRQIAEALEMEVIKGLEWRLSPYFLAPRRR